MPTQYSIRIRDELAEKLERATDRSRNPYAPTKTAVFERGLELALKELERRK
jgi:predicted transcriptional regulator